MRCAGNKELAKYCYSSVTTQEWLKHLSISHLVNDPLEIEEYEEVILIPDNGNYGSFAGGAYTSDGLPIYSSFQRKGIQTAEELFNRTHLLDLERIEDEVVYLGQYRNQWGSFLVDSISRLWYALKHPEKKKYVYLGTQPVLGGMHTNACKFLELLGISQDQVIYVTKPTAIRKMIIPAMSLVPTGTIPVKEDELIPRYSREYLDTVYKVVDQIELSGVETHEKVYFSRGRFSAKSKTDFGEELIADMMRANGYYIVYPEEHTLEEQIIYVNTCKVFASIGGSCAHNIIFSKAKPQMILFNRMNGYQWHQWMLDEMAGVEPITYVDMYCEPYKHFFETTISGPYLYLINRNVQRFASDLGMIIPRSCMSIWRQCKIISRYTCRVIRTICSKLQHRIMG